MESSQFSTTATLEKHRIVPILHNAKITIFIECEDILKPDANLVGKYTFQTGSEVVTNLQLYHLVDVSMFSQVKIKLIHTCGSLDLNGEPCLQALWNVGETLVEQYEATGRNARYEKWINGRTEDWLEVDAKVVVYLD